MFWIVLTIDGIAAALFTIYFTGSFWYGVLAFIVTAILSGAMFRFYQIISAGLWGYLLYKWLIPLQPEHVVVLIITIVVLIRLAIAWFCYKEEIGPKPANPYRYAATFPENVPTHQINDVTEPEIPHEDKGNIVNLQKWANKKKDKNNQ